MRKPPPTVPGMPERNSNPAMPASRAVRATLRSSAPAPARDDLVLGLDLDEAAAQANDHAVDAAVAHQQVRGDADHRHRHIGRLGREESGEIVDIGGAEHHFRGAADAEPGDLRQRRIGGEAAAHLRQAIDQMARCASPPPS